MDDDTSDLALIEQLIEEINSSNEIGVRRRVLTGSGMMEQDFYQFKYKAQCSDDAIDIGLPDKTINDTVLTHFEFKLIQRLAAPPISRVYSKIGKKVDKVFTDLRKARIGIKKRNGSVRVVFKLGSSEFQNIFIDGTFQDISPKKPKIDKTQLIRQICTLMKNVDEDDLCSLMDQLKTTSTEEK